MTTWIDVFIFYLFNQGINQLKDKQSSTLVIFHGLPGFLVFSSLVNFFPFKNVKTVDLTTPKVSFMVYCYAGTMFQTYISSDVT